jgi:hypothetical protein
VQGKVFVFGGRWEDTLYNELFVLDLDVMEWMKPKFWGNPPSPRYFHTCTHINGKLWILGGSKPSVSRGFGSHADLCCFDLNRSTWTTRKIHWTRDYLSVQPKSTSRTKAAFSPKGSINDEQNQPLLSSYQSEEPQKQRPIIEELTILDDFSSRGKSSKSKERASMETPESKREVEGEDIDIDDDATPGITNHTAVGYRKYLIVCGGRNSTFAKYHPNVLYIYDTELDKWGPLKTANNLFAELELGDFHSACMVTETEMLVYGEIIEDEDHKYFSTAILRFPSSTEGNDAFFDWVAPRVAGVLPIGGRHRQLVNVHNDRIYMMGGRYDFEKQSIASIHYFEFTVEEPRCCPCM